MRRLSVTRGLALAGFATLIVISSVSLNSESAHALPARSTIRPTRPFQKIIKIARHVEPSHSYSAFLHVAEPVISASRRHAAHKLIAPVTQPVSMSTAPKQMSQASGIIIPAYFGYTVRTGDTFASIAYRYHDSSWLIRKRNAWITYLTAGTRLQLLHWPVVRDALVSAIRPTSNDIHYTIHSGDTLSSIATGLHQSVLDIESKNHVTGQTILYPGQMLSLTSALKRVQAVLEKSRISTMSKGLLLTDAAAIVGIDAPLVKALSWHESGWRMVSGWSGEVGMMQLMPATSAWVQQTLIGYKLDPRNTFNNAFEGSLLLDYYLNTTGQDVHKALALYHSGNTAADKRNGVYIAAIVHLRGWFYHHPGIATSSGLVCNPGFDTFC